MKTVLKRIALRVPLIGSLARRRHLLRLRMRALLAPVNSPSTRVRLEVLRKDVGRLLRLSPGFVVQDRPAYFEASHLALQAEAARSCSDVLTEHPQNAFHLRRFCLCCNETTPMLVDYQSASAPEDGSRAPNWRERLVCGSCGMNNRQRLVAKLVQQAAGQFLRPRIYLMEQVTPIFDWVSALDGIEVHGSEYLGHQYRGGDGVNGVRHEDVMDLSYPDASFDLIVSNDVLEHIPDPERAFRECFRVLRPGGAVLATFPFHVANDTTSVRARLVDGELQHLLPPQYHGNPVSSDGSLVFQDFGWDLLDVMRGAGFAPAVCEWYTSDVFGHLGTGLLVFRVGKPRDTSAA